MRILALHNRYLVPGGEDQSHTVEMSLLRGQGHTVDEYMVDNAVIEKQPILKVALNTIWSQDSYVKVKKILRENHYDLVIVQNFFPLLSPSIHYAAKSEKVPVIQFLRNYRQFCLNGLALRENKPCEACLGRLPLPGVVHACYRDSHLASLVVALMIVVHRILKTWHNMVDVFVVLTEFAKRMNVRAGLHVNKIFVKPNFIHPDPGMGQGAGNYVLFVGRLSEEKGLHTLLEAWKILGNTVKLKIVGDGPLQSMVEDAVCSNPFIDYLGRQQQSEIFELMKNAAFLVFPSLCYENMPRTIIESLAVGTPILAGEIGAASEIIEPGKSGHFFRAGDAADLAERVRILISEPELRNKMRMQARHEYEAKYTLEKNLAFWAQLQDRIAGKHIDMTVTILNVKLECTTYLDAAKHITSWVSNFKSRTVFAANVHMLMEAYDSPQYKQIVNSADLVAPDGMPLVWMMRLKGQKDQQRVYGPTLMLHVLEAAARENIPVGFYGSSSEVLHALMARMQTRFPSLKIVYSFSPPFREMSEDENDWVVDNINKSGARILFVGLGCPKQEKWMAEHSGKINTVMLGVGAAFDFHAGVKSQAPAWMQKLGLEWFYRLVTEPRRLWWRYLYHNPRFVFLAILDLFGLLR